MTTRIANLFTAAGRFAPLLALAAFVALILFAANGMGFRFDPFNRAEHRADGAEAVAAVATSNASARSVEVEGARSVTVAVERTTSRIRAAEAVVTIHEQLAEEAPDATEPLDPARLERLRIADVCLCRLSPRLCSGDPAPTRNAGDGDPALCPAAPG